MTDSISIRYFKFYVRIRHETFALKKGIQPSSRSCGGYAELSPRCPTPGASTFPSLLFPNAILNDDLGSNYLRKAFFISTFRVQTGL